MSTMKTLIIRPADVSLNPLGAGSNVADARVSVVYDRDVWVNGQPVPRVPLVETTIPTTGLRVPVLASDDPSITEGAGFVIKVIVETTPRVGPHNDTGATLARTIQVVTADPDEIPLGTKPNMLVVSDAQQYTDLASAIDAINEVAAGTASAANDAASARQDASTAAQAAKDAAAVAMEADAKSTQAVDASTAAQQAMAQWTAQAPLGGPAAQVLQAYRQYGGSNLTVGIVGDTSWARQWSKDYGQALPSGLSRTFGLWSGSSWAWQQDAAGDGGTPASGGVAVQDAFGRTGEVIGSTPDIGTAWTGTAGTWTSDGAVAKASGTGRLYAQAPAGDVTLSATVPIVTAATSAAQQWRFTVLAPSATSGDGVWGFIQVVANGAVTLGLYKTIGGTSTALGSVAVPAAFVGVQQTAQVATVSLDITGTTVTFKVATARASDTVTASLSSSDIAALGRYAGVAPAQASTPGFSLDQISVSAPYRPGSPAPGITWLVRPGLSTTGLSDAFPATPRVDVLIIAADQAAATTFVTAFRALPGQSAPTVLVAAGTDVPALTMPIAPAALSAVSSDVAALKAAPTPISVKGSPLEMLRTLKGIGDGQVRVGVISDSTANDSTDWVRVWMQKWGSTLPSRVNRTYAAWNDTTGAWGASTVDNAGQAPAPGVVVADSFTRFGEVVGSTPDGSGPAWAGQTGYWTATGSQAVNTTGFASLNANLGSGDQIATVNLTINTAAPSAAQSFRVYLGAGGAGTGLYVILSLSTAGVLTMQIFKNLQGGSGNAALTSATPVAGVSAGQTGVALKLSMTTQIQNVSVTATIGAQTTTLTGQISEAEVFQRGYMAYVSGGAAGTYFAAIDDVTLKTPAADNPPPTPTLTVWNGAKPGAGLTWWNAAKRAQVFGGKTLDVIVISLGHNQQTQAPADFVSAVSSMVSAIATEHPEASILISSQNPQQTPATGVAAHRARQAALRVWARSQGYDYVPAFEAFAAQADGGKSLVTTDGVHPTTPASGVTDGSYGSVLWADTMTQTIEA